MRYTRLFARFSLIVVVLLIAACSDTASDSTNPDVGPATLIPAPPLDAPLDLTISTNNGAVTLSWSEVAAKNDNDVPGYNIYWNKTGNVTNANTSIENVLSPHIVEGLTVGETYYFVVTARDSNEESKPSFEIFATVPLPVLVSISLEPENISIASGISTQLRAIGLFSDSSVIDLTSSVDWRSENIKFSIVDSKINKGYVTARGIGTTTIYATDPISNISGETSIRTQINHDKFGTPLLSCDSSGCHSLPAGHINTSIMCKSCHTDIETFKWKPITILNHSLTVDTCETCHDGTTATDKSAIHILTSDICTSCHSYNQWIPIITVDHTQTIGTCISCHLGTITVANTENHILASDLCEACHTISGWIPATKVDHNETIGTCISCHDGVIAGSKTNSHTEPTSDICDACHSNLRWTPATMDHTQIIGVTTCYSCHNNITATGKSSIHISSTDICDDCHSVSTWTIP